MGYFNIDGDELVRLLLPVSWREPVQRGWLGALLAPVFYIYSLFMSLRNRNLYDLAHNGQVALLEAVLNDALDPEGRNIYITDYEVGRLVYLYVGAEGRPPTYLRCEYEMMGAVYLYTEEELTTGGTFVVNVGISLDDEVLLRALLNKYKLAGMNYIIKYY